MSVMSDDDQCSFMRRITINLRILQAGDVAHRLVSHNHQFGRILHIPHTRRGARADGLCFARRAPPVAPRPMRGRQLRFAQCFVLAALAACSVKYCKQAL